MKEYKLDHNNCSYAVMEKLFSGVKFVDGYKVIVSVIGTDYKIFDIVFTVKTDINGYYASYYSYANDREYRINFDGFIEIIDLIDLINRKEDIDYFLRVREGE